MTNNLNEFDKVEQLVVANHLAPIDDRAKTSVESEPDAEVTPPPYFPKHIKLLKEGELTPTQDERLITLEEFYSTDKSLQIVSALTSHGSNAWKPLMEKVYEFSISAVSDDKYNVALEARLQLGKTYSTRDIMRIVNAERRALEMKPHLTDIFKNCLADVSKMFMVHIDYDEKPESKIGVPISITPFINLSAQL